MSVLTALQEILVKDYKVARESLAPSAHLTELGIDSLGLLELMFKIEDHFHLKIPGDPPSDLETVADVCSYIDALIAGQQSSKHPESNPAVKS